MDDTDGISWQWLGKKLWVFVKQEEALAHRIVTSQLDAMTEPTPGLYRLIDWMRCPSFQWCVVSEGDALVLPRDRMHAVCCIGDHDSVASSIYLSL